MRVLQRPSLWVGLRKHVGSARARYMRMTQRDTSIHVNARPTDTINALQEVDKLATPPLRAETAENLVAGIGAGLQCKICFVQLLLREFTHFHKETSHNTCLRRMKYGPSYDYLCSTDWFNQFRNRHRIAGPVVWILEEAPRHVSLWTTSCHDDLGGHARRTACEPTFPPMLGMHSSA